LLSDPTRVTQRAGKFDHHHEGTPNTYLQAMLAFFASSAVLTVTTSTLAVAAPAPDGVKCKGHRTGFIV
jgi:hypothetical protein